LAEIRFWTTVTVGEVATIGEMEKTKVEGKE
jgi:hypothetical protein